MKSKNKISSSKKKKSDLPKKIRVECELFGALTKKFRNNNVSFFVPYGLTYQDFLLKYLKFSRKYLRYFSILVNDKKVDNLNKKITRNIKKITVLLPLSGG